MTQLELPIGENVKTMKAKTKLRMKKVAAAPKLSKRARKAVTKKTVAKVCIRCHTRPVKSPRSSRCPDCQAIVRKKQLLANNAEWRSRVRKGKAGHHVVYKGKPSKWAAENRMKAVAQLRKYRAPSVETKQLKKLLKLA